MRGLRDFALKGDTSTNVTDALPALCRIPPAARSFCRDQVIDCIAESLSILETPIMTKVARLFLVSDILNNCSAHVRNASSYRQGFEVKLPQIFRALHETFRSFTSRLRAETFRQYVAHCLAAWRDWNVFGPDFFLMLQNLFKYGSKEKPADPIRQPAPVRQPAGAAVAATPGRQSWSSAGGGAAAAELDPDDEDVDGIPMDDDVDGMPMDDGACMHGAELRSVLALLDGDTSPPLPLLPRHAMPRPTRPVHKSGAPSPLLLAPSPSLPLPVAPRYDPADLDGEPLEPTPAAAPPKRPAGVALSKWDTDDDDDDDDDEDDAAGRDSKRSRRA